MTDVHFAWTAEPGIDLLAQPAAVVRAYLESRLLVAFGGSLDYLYPGFDHAVERNRPVGSSPASTVAVWPEAGKGENIGAGTASVHILRIDQSDANATAVVCQWAWKFAWKQPDGMYAIGSINKGAATGVLMNRVSLAASNFAMSDVFGGWRVVGNLDELISGPDDPEWPEYEHDLAACVARAPDSLERRQFMATGEHPRSEFPTAPTSPGWPAGNQQ